MTNESTSIEALFARADACLGIGLLGEAESHYRRLLVDHPGNFRALYSLGRTLELQARIDEAIAAYDGAIAANPGHAYPFTRRSVLAFRRAFGPPPAPLKASSATPRITMSTLGSNGRFGNQLLQYGFLRMYAAEYGLAVDAPDWIGRDLFDLDDPLPATSLPEISEQEVDLPASLNREVAQIYKNVDLWGYCCYHTARIGRYRDFFRGLYQPGRRVAALVEPAIAKLRDGGATLVAIHLRRGDFGHGQFWIAPSDWYGDWLDTLWPKLNRPRLYVATDDPSVVAELARFQPVVAADLDVVIPGAEYYLDFHVLAAADALAISNSTFSFVAGMLNGRAREFMRPVRAAACLAPFDPWNAEVLL
jgi:hypothetical protein